MTISGGIKFFEPNYADSKTGAYISGGNASTPFILDRNKYTYWRSVGSNDATPEIYTVYLGSTQTVDRIFFLNHNWKNYVISYWSGGGQPFTNVVGINGISTSGITETDYALSSSYYEFDPVVTDRFLIRAATTQIPNQEKYLNSFVTSEEIATLEGYPIIKDVTKDKKSRKSILLNGRSFVEKSLEVMRFSIDFKNYPPGLTTDLDLLVTLFERDINFNVWLCGGRNGVPYFQYQFPGFRIEDLIEMQVTNIFKDKYRGNFYNGVVDQKLLLEEAG